MNMSYHEYLSRPPNLKTGFYKFPKQLIDADEFRFISIEARLLYAIMLNRCELSAKNGWIEDGHLFVIFKITEIMEIMGCSNRKAIKMLTELEQTGLADIHRRGKNRANLIFLRSLEPSTGDEMTLQEVNNRHVVKCNSVTPGSDENALQEVTELHTRYTDLRYTDSKKTEIKKTDIRKESSEDYARRSIEYDRLCREYPDQTAVINVIVRIMAECMDSPYPTIAVYGEDKPKEVVKSVMMKLRYEHIARALQITDEEKGNIRSVKPFFRTLLYNMYFTPDNPFRARDSPDTEDKIEYARGDEDSSCERYGFGNGSTDTDFGAFSFSGSSLQGDRR